MNPFMQIVGLSLLVHLFVIIFAAAVNSLRVFNRWMHHRRMLMRYLAVSTIANVAAFVLMGAGLIVATSIGTDDSTPRLLAKLNERTSKAGVLHARDEDIPARTLPVAFAEEPVVIELQPLTATVPFTPPVSVPVAVAQPKDSLVDYLRRKQWPSAYADRAMLARSFLGEPYRGTAAQNQLLLRQLKEWDSSRWGI